jgi:alpha-beta hydrolase superfamily lysophospholipase
MVPETSERRVETVTIEDGVNEEPVLLGPGADVVGILTRAAAGAVQQERPAVIFLSAGVIHRVGPHRLHVTMARHLARRGFTALRLDVSGVGDSPLHGGLSFRQQAVADARAAMDRLTALAGARRFVLFGLCSGADNGLATALEDDRVVGLVLVDPYTYPTLRSRLRKAVARARQLGTARRVVAWAARLAARRIGERVRRTLGQAEDPRESSGREPPPAETLGRLLESLVARRVRVLACYSGALEENYNHEDQIFEIWPGLRDRVDRAFFPRANHVFTELAARRALVTAVSDWLDARGA